MKDTPIGHLNRILFNNHYEETFVFLCSGQKYIILAAILLVIIGVLALIIGLSVGLSSKSTITSASSITTSTNPA